MGSPNGLWTAVSGGMAQSQNLDIIANNLANVNTTGFKKDAATFKEYLTAVERPPSPAIDIPRTIFKDSDFYHFDGREHAMVNLDAVHTDHSQGVLKPTNAPYDIGIDGPGFFAVQSPGGLRYTRAGDFKVNAQGFLVTSDNYPVMALAGDALAAKDAAIQAAAQGTPGVVPGAPPAQPGAAATRAPASVNPFTAPAPAPGQQPVLAPINLRDAIATGAKLHIAPTGQIYSDDTLVATIAVAEFADPQRLTKITSTLYDNGDPANVPRVAEQSNVRQGFLEASNVNPVSELLELLKVNRMYESNMRAIKAYNDMAGKEANEVGKL